MIGEGNVLHKRRQDRATLPDLWAADYSFSVRSNGQASDREGMTELNHDDFSHKKNRRV